MAASDRWRSPFAIPIVPWTLHVSNAEGRFVPISTGGGKALFIGTYLPGNGLHLDVKRELLRRFEGRENIPATELSRISMTPLLNRVASGTPTSSATPRCRRSAARTPSAT